MSASLSKSRFLSAAQCELRLWYETYERHRMTRASAAMESVFATGQEVGVLARGRYPGGVLVEEDHRHAREAITSTRALLGEKSTPCPALYEAAFEHQGVLVRPDILLRVAHGVHTQPSDSAWDLLEVKSTTRAKANHDLDLAIQLWVLRGAGLRVRRACVLTLDRRYVWPGGEYDLNALFRLHDRTAGVEALQADIAPRVARLHAMLDAAQPPSIVAGAQCTRPHTCPFLAHCTRDVVQPEWPLRSLPALNAKRREALEAQGIDDVRDIPPSADLSALQKIARDAVIAGGEVIHGELAAVLATIDFPVHHLDFETVGPALPRYPNTCAYDAVPFQFSIHTQHRDGTIEHIEYLHPDGSDPREPLAQALLNAVGERGSIVVYTGFEQRVINALAAILPAQAARLRALLPRLWDLHPVVRDNYYHADFRGSFSIKSVLPALVAELSYDDLSIADGNLAALSYLHALDSSDVQERERLFAALREYCGRDTLALLRIRAALAQRAAIA